MQRLMNKILERPLIMLIFDLGEISRGGARDVKSQCFEGSVNSGRGDFSQPPTLIDRGGPPTIPRP